MVGSTHTKPLIERDVAGSGRLMSGVKERRERRFEKRAVALLIIVAAVFIAARLWRLTSYGLFGDEVFTLWTAQQDWKNMFTSVVGDVVHPPLFYVLLKVWIGAGGQSLLWLKLLPALLSVGSLIPFVLLCRELKLSPAAMRMAILLMGVNGFLITHAQELRMYSLLLLLGTSSLWLFAKRIGRDNHPRRVEFALLIVNLLLVFTHYFGWIVVGLEVVVSSIWRRNLLRSLAIAAVFLAICFSPWVYFVAHAARENPSRVNFVWNQPPAISELIGYYGNLNGPLSYRWKVIGTALVMALFLLPVISYCARVFRAPPARMEASTLHFWFLALFAFGPAALAFLGSHVLPQPIWAYRYLITAAPVYFLVVAVAAHAVPRDRIRTALVVLIVGWASLSGFTQMVGRNRIAWEPLVNRMRETETAGTGGIRVYVTDANVGNTIRFYLDNAGETRFEVSATETLDRGEGGHWWVAFIRYTHESQPLPQDLLTYMGCKVGDAIESEVSGQRAILFPVWNR